MMTILLSSTSIRATSTPAARVARMARVKSRCRNALIRRDIELNQSAGAASGRTTLAVEWSEAASHRRAARIRFGNAKVVSANNNNANQYPPQVFEIKQESRALCPTPAPQGFDYLDGNLITPGARCFGGLQPCSGESCRVGTARCTPRGRSSRIAAAR